jgi:hypothetical protein
MLAGICSVFAPVFVPIFVNAVFVPAFVPCFGLELSLETHGACSYMPYLPITSFQIHRTRTCIWNFGIRYLSACNVLELVVAAVVEPPAM